MANKYFIINCDTMDVTKTDNDMTAKHFAQSHDHMVIDKETEAVLFEDQVDAINIDMYNEGPQT